MISCHQQNRKLPNISEFQMTRTTINKILHNITPEAVQKLKSNKNSMLNSLKPHFYFKYVMDKTQTSHLWYNQDIQVSDLVSHSNTLSLTISWILDCCHKTLKYFLEIMFTLCDEGILCCRAIVGLLVLSGDFAPSRWDLFRNNVVQVWQVYQIIFGRSSEGQ